MRALSPLLLIAALACAAPASEPSLPAPSFEVGADLSEALYAQDRGVVFHDTDGAPKDALQIFVDHGYTWARVRVNVDPPDNPQYAMFTDLAYAARLGAAAKARGLKLLVDLHYSHWWADPGNQWTPPGWQTEDPAALAATVHDWTTRALRQLREAGAVPDAVQIGNEIHHGMLWELGGPYRPGGSAINLAAFVAAGVEAAEASLPEAQVVLHLATGGDLSATLEWIAAFEAAGGPWARVDVLGLSYYPMWHGGLQDLARTLDGVAEAHPQVQLSIVETAYYWSPHEGDFGAEGWAWPETPAGQASFLRDVRRVAEDRPRVTSVFYWGAAWAQSSRWLEAPGWSDDDASRRSLFDDDAVATEGIDALTTP